MIRPIRFLSGIILVAALCTAAGWSLYAPALRAPFVFDDIDNIVNNPRIRLTAVTPDALAVVMENQFGNRPLAYASFALNYYIGRYDVAGYRLVNLAIHIFSALLVFLVARLTPGPDGKQGAGTAFLAAALWLVNPVHTQSVTYIVQRMNALSAMFVLLAMVCYITARRLQRQGRTGYRPLILLAGTALSGLCGLAAKETAAILPVLLLLYEWFFFQDLSRAWLKKQLAWIGPAALAAVVAALVLTAGHPFEKLAGMYAKLDFTPGQRLLTEPGVILYYLTLLLFPHPDRLNLDYRFPAADSMLQPAITLPAICALAALAAVAVVAAGKHRLYAFSVFWFLAALAIESSFLGLALIFEHRTYLPSVFPAIAAAHFLTRRIKPAPAGAIAICLLIALCAWGTYRRNRVWADPLTFWQDCNTKTPFSPRILNNLGVAFKDINKIEAARQSFQEALRYDPEWLSALSNLGTILMDQNRPNEALGLFDKAVAIEPEYYDGHYNRGLALMAMNKILTAITAFREALRLNPFYEKAHNNLGVALMRQLNIEQAIVHLHRALELDPYFVKAWSNLGIACFKKGMTDEARACFNRALDIDPFHVEAYNNLKRITYLIDTQVEEISRLRQELLRQPDHPQTHFRLAETYEKAGMPVPALEHYLRVLSLQPDAVDCLSRLGSLYAAHYQYPQAVTMFERMLELLPDSAKIHYNLACVYSLQEQPEKALYHLQTALEKGYNDWNQIMTDKDIEFIRNTEYFKKIIANHQTKERE
ncbi:MAG: tetratricopeptide repeat protein [Thermodesulfobacteriota bacterium]